LSISLSINTYIFLSDNLSLPGLAKLILKTSFNREFKPLFTYEILIQPYIWKTTFIWYTLRNFFLFRAHVLRVMMSCIGEMISYSGCHIIQISWFNKTPWNNCLWINININKWCILSYTFSHSINLYQLYT
jgi:hypothetical protein